MKKLSVFLIAALLIIFATKSAKADVELITDNCDCRTERPSPTPSPTQTPTPTVTVTPGPTEPPHKIVKCQTLG